MTLYLTRDMGMDEEDEPETILWEVGENDPLPELREDGRWFSGSLQALFPLTEQLAVPPGRIVRVSLGMAKPRRRRPGEPRRPGVAGRPAGTA